MEPGGPFPTYENSIDARGRRRCQSEAQRQWAGAMGRDGDDESRPGRRPGAPLLPPTGPFIDGLLAVEQPEEPSWWIWPAVDFSYRGFHGAEDLQVGPGQDPAPTGVSAVTSCTSAPGLLVFGLPPRHGGGRRCGGQLFLIRRPRTPPEAHRSLGFQRSDFSVQGISRFPSPAACFCTGFFSEPCGLCGGSTQAAYSGYPLAGPLKDPFVRILLGFQPRPMSTSTPIQQPQSTPGCPAGDALGGESIGGG